MRHFTYIFGMLVAVLAFAAPTISKEMPPLARAYYWDVADDPSLTDASRIERLQHLGATEVHIWLNGNNRTPACNYRFRYTDGAVLWQPARLETFARALKSAGLKPVFIFSPDLRTTGYIASLSEHDGPLAVAARVGGVDIELDIEGNGESAKPCPDDGLSRDAADHKLIDAIHATTSTSKIIMSSTSGWAGKHPVLTGPGGADAISPQLYGAHYADGLKAIRKGIDAFVAKYPTKPIWAGLSVECSVADAKRGLCSEAQFDASLKLLADANERAPGRVTKYVVWGEREARACPAKPLCSVYAEGYLKRTASP